MFNGFKLEHVPTGEATLRVRHGGKGPPLLLLHSHPQTHMCWHRIAPRLAEDFFVVCPDLRGYGGSSKPLTTPDHEPYSKRTMARDMLALMQGLGCERFAVAGHDRGGYVSYRLVLDHPERVTRLAVLDIVPAGEAWRRANDRCMLAWWHWALMAQPAPLAETFFSANPDAYYFRNGRERFHPEALADYLRAVHDPETVHAMCEDYRANATCDRAADDADYASGKRITCPLLVLWAEQDDLGDLYGDPLAVWRGWADDMRGRSLDCGHYLTEEAPDEVYAELYGFLTEVGA